MQLEHQNYKPSKSKFPIILICENIANAANVGGILRIADSFGIEKIYFVGNLTPMGRKMKKASRATEKYVDFEVVEDMNNLISKLKLDQYRVFALELTTSSSSLETVKFKEYDKVAIIIGNEIEGVSAETLQQAEKIVHINMFGNNSSMNVVSSAAIMLYELTKQIRIGL
ncbi:SpoU rRNA Methylase family protein [Flavobacteriaceae bacterium MAR_2010_188]|nr:SpoU rRNA Methylase family protein [Flavobacteriaceae bacterium MAR_2010_188]